ncbi:MAG: MgtC/SapB family protein [Hyphomicrobiales bacterium]
MADTMFNLPGEGFGYGALALRLGAALLMGALLGIDRQLKAKPMGWRTYMLVSVGSAAYTILVFQVLAVSIEESDRVMLDPSRLVEGLIGGIGFLGAGAIIGERRDRAGNILGGATGASIWVCGAIGVACGLGEYLVGFAITFASLLVLGLTEILERMLGWREGFVEERHRRKK